MSRYTIVRQPDLEVVVGFDPPLETFFAQAMRPSHSETEDDTMLLWVGTAPQAITSLEALEQALERVIPEPIRTALAEDQAHCAAPTPLQRWMRQLMEQEHEQP